jgi:hypothetical protein
VQDPIVWQMLVKDGSQPVVHPQGQLLHPHQVPAVHWPPLMSRDSRSVKTVSVSLLNTNLGMDRIAFSTLLT